MLDPVCWVVGRSLRARFLWWHHRLHGVTAPQCKLGQVDVSVIALVAIIFAFFCISYLTRLKKGACHRGVPTPLVLRKCSAQRNSVVLSGSGESVCPARGLPRLRRRPCCAGARCLAPAPGPVGYTRHDEGRRYGRSERRCARLRTEISALGLSAPLNRPPQETQST